MEVQSRLKLIGQQSKYGKSVFSVWYVPKDGRTQGITQMYSLSLSHTHSHSLSLSVTNGDYHQIDTHSASHACSVFSCTG